jgi:SnoaL-like domain
VTASGSGNGPHLTPGSPPSEGGDRMPARQPVSADDYVAIQRLMSRASDAVTRRDMTQFGSCWTEEAAWHLGSIRPPMIGRATILEDFPRILASLEAAVQTVDNGDAWYVDGTTDVAESRFYITELIRRSTGASDLLRAFYADRLVRAPDGWLFAERHLHPLYAGPADLSGSFVSRSTS